MILINLKKYSNEYFNFIYSDEKRFIYTTKRFIKNIEYFYICNYYIEEELEVIIKKFIVEKDTYYDYKVFYKSGNIFILYKKQNVLSVTRISSFKNIFEEKEFSIYLDGDIKHTDILNERYFIAFIERKDILGSKYKAYRSSKRYSYKFSYLVDLEESESYFIYDVKFALGARDYIKLIYINGLECIFFEEAYREAWEKEFYYFKGIFESDKNIKSNNSLNYMDFDSFIFNIKTGSENLKFEIIKSIGEEGTIRYLGEDYKNLYYRELYFESRIEKIYLFEKITEKMIEISEVDHNKRQGEFYYNSDKITVFYEEELDDYNRLVGIFNRTCDIVYSKNIGMFEDFIEDRYLITYYSDEYDGDNFNYAVVKDMKLNKEIQYDGNIRSIGEYVVLY